MLKWDTYIKSDGSIDDGFEIVSHPMTLDYHMDEIDLESVLSKAINIGYHRLVFSGAKSEVLRLSREGRVILDLSQG